MNLSITLTTFNPNPNPPTDCASCQVGEHPGDVTLDPRQSMMMSGC